MKFLTALGRAFGLKLLSSERQPSPIETPPEIPRLPPGSPLTSPPPAARQMPPIVAPRVTLRSADWPDTVPIAQAPAPVHVVQSAGGISTPGTEARQMPPLVRPTVATAPADAIVQRTSGPSSYLAVVGESFYQPTLRSLRRELKSDTIAEDEEWLEGEYEFTATLKPEPDNPADPNAIVVLSPEGSPVGYLQRDVAKQFQKRLLTLGQIECAAELRGGSRGKSIGVVLYWAAVRERLMAITVPRAPRKAPVSKLTPHLDPLGQPVNTRFNAARRTERDVSELLGLAKGMLVDGVVTEEEAGYLRAWGKNHPDASLQWPLAPSFGRLWHFFEDGRVDDDERRELQELLAGIVGGTTSLTHGYEGAMTLPFDTPAPAICWGPEHVYVFTGHFAYGTREHCEREVLQRGGICEGAVTKRTSFLVIGTFGSRDWAQTSYGRKIQKAVGLRQNGAAIRIVGEDHWANALATPTVESRG